MARSRLLTGASTPVLGRAVASGVGIGSIQYYAADPGAGFLKADGSPFSPMGYPALVAATPRKLGSKFGFINNPGGYTSKSVAYGNGTWVVVGNGSLAAYSKDGANWTKTGLPQGNVDVTCVTWGNGLFVAGGGAPYCYTSPDGITWTYRGGLPEQNQNILSLAYGNGMYVMGKANGVYLRSTDAITWTYPASMPNVGSGYYYSITFANGLFAALASAPSGNPSCLWTSPDGINWTQRSLPSLGQWINITYGNGVWIILNIQYSYIYSSLDVTSGSWTSRPLPGGSLGSLRGMSAGDGLYILSADGGIFSSPDLFTWTSRSVDMGPNAGKSSLFSTFADSRHVSGAFESTVAFSNYCLANVAEGTLANGQPAIPYVKAA